MFRALRDFLGGSFLFGLLSSPLLDVKFCGGAGASALPSALILPAIVQFPGYPVCIL